MKSRVGVLGFGALLGVFVGASACSSSDTSASPGADAAASDAASQSETRADGSASSDASTSDGPTSGACNTLVNGAPEAMAGTVNGDAPTATGGTIADGTYFLTDFTVYDPAGNAQAPSPSGLRITLAVKGNLMESIQTLPDDSSDTFAETFVVNGTAIDRTLTCPKNAPDLKAVYSVGDKTLTLYETDPASKLVAGSVFVKQ